MMITCGCGSGCHKASRAAPLILLQTFQKLVANFSTNSPTLMQSWAKVVSLSNTRDFRHVCVSLHSKLWSEKINDKPIGLFIIMVFENNRMVLAREGLARCACPDALRISGVHSPCAAVCIHLEHSLFFSSQIDSSLRLISSRSYPATLLLTMHYGEVEKHNDVIHPWQSIGRSRK